MKQAKIKLINGYYSAIQQESREIYILAKFLTDDVGSDIEYWINWIADDKSFGNAGNWSLLDKDKENYITLSDVVLSYHYSPDNIPAEHTLKITKSELINVLEKWHELYANSASEIMITEENGIYKIFEAIG